MGAALDDAVIVDHEHLVGVADRAQAMGDDKGGASLQKALLRPLDVHLGAGIHAAGRLVVTNQNADSPYYIRDHALYNRGAWVALCNVA